MTSNNKTANSRRVDRGTGGCFCEVGRSRSTRGTNQNLKVNRTQKQSTNEEPKLPKEYRHIRSAIEAVLECSGEQVSR
jgi:hypothetical protein